jgi:hypothetical protein
MVYSLLRESKGPAAKVSSSKNSALEAEQVEQQLPLLLLLLLLLLTIRSLLLSAGTIHQNTASNVRTEALQCTQ